MKPEMQRKGNVMKQYETVIHIVTAGFDEYDAGEKAGQFLKDLFSSEEDFYIYCEPTKPYHIEPYRAQRKLANAVM